MKKHMTQEVAIKSAWMILEGLGFSREINGDLEKTVAAVFASAPAADVVPVRHGWWIHEPGHIPHCSECGRYSDDADTGEAICCPFCGARMNRGQDDA